MAAVGANTSGITSTGSADSTEAPDIGDAELKGLEVIGKGNFGQVYRGVCRGKAVAVKRLYKELDAKVLEEFRKEVAVLTHLRHPNVVLFMGACTEAGKLAIVTEYMPRGDVGRLIHAPNAAMTVPLLVRLRMARDIALGMNWLHCSKPPIIHRDLKPGNLLVDENHNVKICDFGLSQFQRTKTFRDEGFAAGTPLWMAPEVLLGKNLTEKVDVYSFAIVFWEMLTGHEPFGEFTSFNSFVDAVVDNHVRPSIPPDMHPALAKLLTECWEGEYYLRPSFRDIIGRLEAIMVDATVPCPQAAALWKRVFPGQLSVPWPRFVAELCAEFKTPVEPTSIEYRCLRRLVTPPGNEPDDARTVALERWGRVLQWFGPVRGDSWTVVARIAGTMQHAWFHGDIERGACETLLGGFSHKPGTFLVRLSTTEPIERTPFTLSKVTRDGSVSHQRINRLEGAKGYALTLKRKDGSSKTLEALGGIEHLVQLCSRALGLVHACAGSKYRDLFEQAKVNGYGYDMAEIDEDTTELGHYH